MGVEEAAEAILEIVNENMHAALRVVSVERGHDPREFGLVAFGGAGPMHANALGRLIRSRSVIVPPTPGVMSAFGFLSSDIQNEFPETYLRIAEETPASELKETIEGLIAQADEWLDGEGVEEDKKRFDLYADCRYYLQNIQIPCRFELDELDRRATAPSCASGSRRPTASATTSTCPTRRWRSPPSASSGAAP